MPEINISLHHESISELEEILTRFRELSAEFEWYDLNIKTDNCCPKCDGDIIGDYDVDGWHYRCELCHFRMELNGDELQDEEIKKILGINIGK